MIKKQNIFKTALWDPEKQQTGNPKPAGGQAWEPFRTQRPDDLWQGYDAAPKIETLRQTGTKSAADSHRLLQESAYTPVSPDLSDPIKVAPQNLKRERTLKELAQKQIAPVTAEFGYTPAASLSRVEKLELGRNLGNKTVSTGYHGDWYAVQPEETAGGITYREYTPIPEDYAGIIAEWEAAKNEYEFISQKMEEYAREYNYLDYADTPGYKALSAAHYRAWKRYSELEDAKNDEMWSKVGGVIAGSAKMSLGQLLSAGGTMLEAMAQYGNDPWQNEMISFNPSMEIPERDITLVREYVTDPVRDYGDYLAESGAAQVEAQKEGLGKFGEFAVDLGSAATQMALDLGLGWLTGGGMALSAAVRTFGSSSTEARADAELNEQFLYAATSAMLSYGVEQVCNVAYSGIKAVLPGISDKVLTEGIEKLAQKLASSPDGVELLMKLGKVIASGASEGGEEALEAALQPFLQKLIYDHDAETILDNPALFWDYAYEALIGGILGMFGGSVNADANTDVNSEVDAKTEIAQAADSTVQSPVERGIMLWEQQLYEAAGELEQDAGRQAAGGVSPHTQLELMDQNELNDFDPWTLFEADEESNTDSETGNRTVNEESESADIWEKNFLSGLRGDTENDTIFGENHGKPIDAAQDSQNAGQASESTVRSPEERGIRLLEQQLQEAFEQAEQERLAEEGTELLDRGGMPSDEQLNAMGMDKPTARGFQSFVWLSKEGNPAAQRAVEAMIDQTAPETQEEQQEADTARVSVGVNAHTLSGFGGTSGSTGFEVAVFDSTADYQPENSARQTFEVRGGKNQTDSIVVHFQYNSKYDEAEFAQQLADQQKGMNELTVQEYLDNRRRYLEQGRSAESNLVQQAVREKAFVDKVDELQDAGVPLRDAEEQARLWLATQAALHNPDQIAGGYAQSVEGVGNRNINASIGAQWRHRINTVDDQLRNIALGMTEDERLTTYLNIHLTYKGD